MSDIKINFNEVEFDVYYDYTPGEKEVLYYSDGSGHPGCPETIDVTGVELCGIDWYDYLTPKALEEIEQAVWDYREEY